MVVLLLIFSCLFPWALGYFFLVLFFGREAPNRMFYFFAAYGLGLGCVALWMMCLAIAGIHYTLGTLLGPLLILLGALWMSAQRRRVKHAALRCAAKECITGLAASMRHWRKIILAILLLIYIFYQICFVFYANFTFPIYSWDGIYLLGTKAKVFYYDGSTVNLRYLMFPAYPLLVPFSMTWIAFVLQEWNEFLVKTCFSVMFLCHLGVIYCFLKDFVSRLWALVGVALLVSANLFTYHAVVSYHDSFMSYYTTTAILFLLWGHLKKNKTFFFLAGIYAGLMTLTKLEGIAYLGLQAFLLVYLLFLDRVHKLRDKVKICLRFFLPALGVYAAYSAFIAAQNFLFFEGRVAFDFSSEKWARLAAILPAFGKAFFYYNNWNILWFLLLVSMLVFQKKIFQYFEIRFLLLALSAFLFFYFLSALVTPNFEPLSGAGHLLVLPRIIIHFFPLAPILIVLLTARGGSAGQNK